MPQPDLLDRVLFLLPESPFPPRAGNAIRDAQHVAVLGLLGWTPVLAHASARRDVGAAEVTAASGGVAALSGGLPRIDRRSLLSTIVRKVAFATVSHEHPFASWLDSAALGRFFVAAIAQSQPRVVITRSLFLHLVPDIRRVFTGPIIVDCHDADEHLARELIATVPVERKAGPWANWRGVRRVFRRLADADEVWAVSEVDRQRIVALVPTARVSVVPSAMAGVADPRPRPGDDRTVLIVGNYAYGPNAAGALWLLRKAWPLVIEQRPDARLVIAGAGASDELRRAALQAGADLLGAVPDLGDLYEQAAVVAVPIHVGGGTRLKVVDACRHGKAIVTTRKGIEGLPMGDHASVVADHPEPFARAITRLLADPSRRWRLGESALKVFDTYLSFGAVAATLGSQWRLPLERGRAWS